MFRLLRKYQKYLLAIGGSILMIVFLLPAGGQMFSGSPQDQPIGTAGGVKLTLGDQHAAAQQIRMLAVFSPILQAGFPTSSPPEWMLARIDAQQMGLHTSDAEVNELIAALGLDETTFRQRVLQMDASTEAMFHALRDWITLQKYQELVYGLSHLSIRQRLDAYAMAFQLLQYGIGQQQAAMMMQGAKGLPRVSEPLLARFLLDQFSVVTMRAITITADRYLDRVSEPDEKTLAELFEAHREHLPDEGEPYGFGYKQPDRVKLEYLTINFADLRSAIEIEEADALAFYQSNPSVFTDAGDGMTPGQIAPYEKVRTTIITQLAEKKATELGLKMIKTAQAMLLEDVRGFSTTEGYRDIPADVSFTPLSKVAQSLQTQFGVLPTVHRHDAEELDRDDLLALKGIGGSYMLDRRITSFPEYVFSARAFSPAPDNPLTSLRLQRGIPSQTLVSQDSSLHLFRLIDVAPARVPESLDEVRQQVVEDAKRREAYTLLLAERDQWTQRVKSEDFDALATELGTTVVKPAPFSKREPDYTGTLQLPYIEGIGQDAAFVNELFDLAREGTKTTNPQATAKDSRSAIPFDPNMELVLVDVIDYQPLSATQFQQLANQREILMLLNHSIGTLRSDSMSYDALAARVGYKPIE